MFDVVAPSAKGFKVLHPIVPRNPTLHDVMNLELRARTAPHAGVLIAFQNIQAPSAVDAAPQNLASVRKDLPMVGVSGVVANGAAALPHNAQNFARDFLGVYFLRGEAVFNSQVGSTVLGSHAVLPCRLSW